MAQIGRTTPTSATTTLAASRSTAGAGGVASVTRAPIEALHAKLGTSLEDAFLSHGNENGDQLAPENHPGDPAMGLLRSTSQAFVAFFEFDSGNEADGESGSRGGLTSFAGVLARAIATYESNARVIHGSVVPRGQKLSFSL